MKTNGMTNREKNNEWQINKVIDSWLADRARIVEHLVTVFDSIVTNETNEAIKNHALQHLYYWSGVAKGINWLRSTLYYPNKDTDSE